MNNSESFYHFCPHLAGRAVLLAFSLVLAGVALADPADAPGSDPLTAGVDGTPASASENVSLIQAQIKDLRELAASMEGVQANLAKVAKRALKDSDSAPTLAERHRYEQLYAEANARMGELQTTRVEITRLLGELEAKLETLQHAR